MREISSTRVLANINRLSLLDFKHKAYAYHNRKQYCLDLGFGNNKGLLFLLKARAVY